MCALVLACTPSFSQQDNSSQKKPTKQFVEPSGHAIGAILSSTNGKGLAYRYWKNRLGVHTSFIPIATDQNQFYNAGVTGYCSLRKYEIGSLFFHLGFEYQREINKDEYYYSSPTGQPIQIKEETQAYNFGFGPGFHVFQKFISMDFYLGYGFYNRTRTNDMPDSKPVESFNTNISGGIAIFLEL
jgi:hypothetical protein